VRKGGFSREIVSKGEKKKKERIDKKKQQSKDDYIVDRKAIGNRIVNNRYFCHFDRFMISK
jgi:hypothetical protein